MHACQRTEYRGKWACYFIKFDKIWPFSTSATLVKVAFLYRKGQAEGGVCVHNGVEGEGCGGNLAQFWGVDKGIGNAQVVAIKVGRRRVVGGSGTGLRPGGLLRTWFGFRGNDGIAWVSILLLFAEPLSAVDLCLDGRGHGLSYEWGGAAGN